MNISSLSSRQRVEKLECIEVFKFRFQISLRLCSMVQENNSSSDGLRPLVASVPTTPSLPELLAASFYCSLYQM